MSSKAQVQSSSLDLVKWLLAAVIVAAGVVGFYYFADQMLVVRVVGLLLAVVAAAAVAATTATGRGIIEFLQDARMEVRKVVWPTRSETLQTGLAVLAMVVVIGLFLWALDSILFWIVRSLTS